jgi:hypothetical protein
MTKRMTTEEKLSRAESRKQARKEEKERLLYESEVNQLKVDSIIISIEWKRSRTWGSNPHAVADVRFKDGQAQMYVRVEGFTCSGCGYDKESTVIAGVFNAFLKYKLHEKGDLTGHPYGIGNYHNENRKYKHVYYEGGVGTSCYPRIAEYIGGKFEKVASGNSFDVWKYTDLSEQKEETAGQDRENYTDDQDRKSYMG